MDAHERPHARFERGVRGSLLRFVDAEEPLVESTRRVRNACDEVCRVRDQMLS
jgi:hypothetical protein